LSVELGGVDVLGVLVLPVLVLVPLVPEPVDGSVLVLLRVPVSLPVVVPVIELSLPLPPVDGEADEPEGCVEALPDVPAAVPDFALVSEAQAPRSNAPAPSAAQTQSLFIFMRVFLP
jgi:hypothetical protein